MKTYAVLDSSNIVTNLIIADTLAIAEQVTSCSCVLVTSNVFVDLGYEYSNGVFSDPSAEETPTEETPA
jgi:hypothetical protein